MFRSGIKIASLFLVLASAFAFSSCGESAATQTSARIGPTSPSGYYFELTVSPSVVPYEGSTNFIVRVWDNFGIPASGVTVLYAGSSDTPGSTTTGTDGIATIGLDVKDRVGTETMTATVESLSVAVSYIVLSSI